MADVTPWMVEIFPERYLAQPKKPKTTKDVPGTKEVREQITSTLSASEQDSEGEDEKFDE